MNLKTSKLERVSVKDSIHETFSRPEWNDSFSVQKPNVSEIKLTIVAYLAESIPERDIAWAILGVGELRSMGKDSEPIHLSKPMNPKGNIKLEITFHPKESQLKRRRAVHQKIYIHNGHRYVPSYFKFFASCAYCHVSIS